MEIKNKFLSRPFWRSIKSYPKWQVFKKGGIKKVAIIGAGGEMGRWFAKFFSRQGLKVFASDIDKKAHSNNA